jgi:hypothetical protein
MVSASRDISTPFPFTRRNSPQTGSFPPRATELVKILIEQHGISAERLSAAGYAEFHPVASNTTSKGRQLNRRVDVVILTVPLPGRLAPEPQPSAPGVTGTSATGSGSAAVDTGTKPSSRGKVS